MYFERRRSVAIILGAALTLGLAACGGGGNESGPGDSLLASPQAVTVTGTATSCAVGTGPTIYVYGGKPPYKLSNSAPKAMTINTDTLQNSGDGFTITFSGGCLDQIPITVEDDVGRVLAVPISNVLGS